MAAGRPPLGSAKKDRVGSCRLTDDEVQLLEAKHGMSIHKVLRLLASRELTQIREQQP